MKIRNKLMLIFCSIILIFSSSILCVIYFSINKITYNNYTKIVEDNSKLGYAYLDKMYPGNWKLSENNLYKGDVLINNNVEVVDFIKNETNSLVTIFLNDTRICTNIIDPESNQRALGTQASPEVIDTVINNGNNFIGKTKVLEKDTLTMYTPLKDSNGNIIGMWFTGIDCSTITDSIFKVFSYICGVIIIIVALGIIIFSKLGKQIVNSIHAFNNYLSIMSKGDFSSSVDEKALKGKDETGDMFRSLVKMQNEIRNILEHIQIQSQETTNTSINLLDIVNELNNIVEEVDNDIAQIAAGLEETAASTEEINSTTHEIELSVEGITNQTIDAVKYSNEIKSKASELHNNSIISKNKALEIYSNSSATLKQAINEANKVKEISKLLDSIASISKQTNLLSLNASIEANKAGEAGRGFSVVANNIKKLADESNNTTNKIKDITALVISAVENLVKNASNLLEFVDKTVIPNYNEFVNTVDSYNNDANYYASMSQKIKDTAESLLIATKDISSAMENVSDAATNGANDALKISQKMNELNSKSNDLNLSAKKCEKISVDLNSAITKLKI